jgi:hypothetical protein
MTCSRCSGFMLESLFLDLESGFGEMWAKMWHCVNCGHTHDPVLERNRLAQQQEEKVLVLSSCGPDDQNYDVPLGPEAYIRPAA